MKWQHALVLIVLCFTSFTAMYMNPDGTIDTIEGWTNERETKCTCSYKKGILTLTEEDGDSRVYFYQSDGTFTFPDSFVGEILVFRRIEEQES